MTVEKLEVLNELGIHARVASRLVRCARGFESSVIAKKDGCDYDLKSVTGIMMLNAKCGELVTVEIDGPDEDEASKSIRDLFAIKFGEN